MRVYYTGSVEDGPRVVEYGGEELVWAPAGFQIEKKDLPVKRADGTDYVVEHAMTGKRTTVMRKQWVVRRNVSGEPMRSNQSESFLSLPDDAARNALRQVWNEDGKLVPEARYKANRSPEFIEAEIERLKAELDLRRGPDPLLSAPAVDDDSKPERKTARERRIERLERASE